MHFLLAVALWMMFFSVLEVRAAVPYKFTPIDFPGANVTEAFGINDAGQIVGDYYFTGSGNEAHGFLLSGGTFSSLDFPGAISTTARGINSNGQIVGFYYTCPSSYGCHHPYLYSDGVYTALPEAPGSMFGTTAAWAINTSGQIVGWYVDPCFCRPHGFLYDAGTYTTIDQPGSYSTAFSGLNDSGVIGGSSGPCWSCSTGSVFLLQGGTFTPINIPISGASSFWVGINNAGDLAGTYYTSQYHIFMLSGGTFTNLDVPGAQYNIAEGQGINSSKRVVGFYGDAGGGVHGFLASPTYNTCLLYDSTKSVKSGATIPVKLEICDGSGADLSSSSITLQAVSITQVSTSASMVVQDSGNANPDNNFRFDSTLGTSGGYIYNLSTKGLNTGSYVVKFTVGGDPYLYTAGFQVR